MRTKSKKHDNQMVRSKAYKNDTKDLVSLGQFLRDVFGKKLRVEREWFIIYDNNDKFLGVSKTVPVGNTHRIKTPDLMLFNGKKLICCIELDGSVHDTIGVGDTLARNELYERLGIPLIVLTKSEMGISMYDDCYGKVEPYIMREKLDAE